MAAIPTYLYFGDVMITGGAQPDTQLPTLWGQFLNNYKFSRAKPSGADGYSTPVSGSFDPYWDGSYNSGTGAFTRYHYVKGLVVLGGGGDNWFQSSGGGVTPCTMLMEALWDRHPTGFKLLKYAQNSAGWGSWKPGGAAWIAARAEWDKMVAAAATNGDTLDVKACIIDCSSTDIIAGSLTYSSDAQAFITGFRANYSSSALITIVSHRPDFYLPGDGAAQAARTIHKTLRVVNANVSVFDMNWAEFGFDGTTGGTTLGPNQIVYETVDYLDAGVRLGRHINNLLSNTTLAETEGPLAVDVFLGDSNFITSFMSSDQVVAGKQRSLLGSVGGTERVGEWIYDDPNEQVVPYDVLGTTNSTGATLEPFFGPECTFLKRMRDKVPTSQRCIFKFAIGGSSLGFLDSGWDAVEAMWGRFLAAVVRDTGRVPDVRSININYGHNDGLAASGAATFEEKAPLLIDMARELFTTRADGDPVLVNWVQNAPHVGNGWAAGTTAGDAASNEAVRQQIKSLPTLRDRVVVILNGDPTTKKVTYELNREDDIHLGGEAVYGVGYALADSVFANAYEGGTATTTETTVDAPSGSAAFTVETGTGSASANSYCTVAFATSYHDSIGNPSLWIAASDAARKDALRRATLGLDLKYAGRWAGIQSTSTQALAWPRIGVVDAAGEDVDEDVIPVRLQQACARGALFELEGKSVLPATVDTADIESESRSMAGGFSKTVTYRGSKPGVAELQVLDYMLMSANLITSGGGWGAAEA